MKKEIITEDQADWEQFLKVKCRLVPCDLELRQSIEEDLEDTAREHSNCVGLSAPQIGLDYAAFVVSGKTKEEYETMFNPMVLKREPGVKSALEGCMSFPKRGEKKVRRLKQVMVRYEDKEGIQHTRILKGFEARVFLHELDHINGINIFD